MQHMYVTWHKDILVTDERITANTLYAVFAVEAILLL